MQQILDDLNWRYATKKFNPEAKLKESDVELILESLRLTPSSMGLQPTKILVIKDQTLREQLVTAANGQRQVMEASHLLVLVSHTTISDDLVNDFLDTVASERKLSRDSLIGFETMIRNFARSRSPEEISAWMKNQNYIVLGHLMQICAQLRIDSTPMEGFSADQFDEILGLKERGLKTDLVVPIGYRDESDPYLQRKKVRRAFSEVVEVR